MTQFPSNLLRQPSQPSPSKEILIIDSESEEQNTMSVFNPEKKPSKSILKKKNIPPQSTPERAPKQLTNLEPTFKDHLSTESSKKNTNNKQKASKSLSYPNSDNDIKITNKN